ncbi:PD-(D/E)XK nuclease family protein, partial [bacterium]|nr:PD-(D/E)XK nuclease family protein [bacterium]
SSVVSHLRREGIPALALTPHGFWASEEISFFVHLLNFLHEPRNTKDLFYLLTSPIFGVDSETIRRLPSSTPEDFLWNRIEKNYQDGTIEDKALKKGYEKLKQVLEEAKDRPVWRIISDFLDDERIFSILTGSAPEVKIPNLLKLMDIITSYEWAGMNLEQIVEQVNAAEEENETPLAGPINTKNFVQVSTIHSAKGLEAQIVIVLDKYGPKSDNNPFYFEKEIPGKFIPKIKQLQELTPVLCGGYEAKSESVAYKLSLDKREAEDKRLLYVALTRAQEKVYLVPHKNKRNQSWWLGKIKEALGIKKSEDLKNPSALPEGVQVIALDHIPQKETLFDRKPQGSVAEFLNSIPPDRTEISATVLAEFLLCPQFFAFNTNPPEDAGKFGFSLKKSDAAERGKKIHQLASLVAVYPPEEIFTYAQNIIGDPQEAEKIASLLEKFYTEEIAKCPHTPETEVPLVFAHEGITISGQADLVCGNTIYDFKTGRKDDFARALYSIQLDLYRLACAAAREISPGEIETKIVWLSEDNFEIQTTPHDPEILRKIEDFKDFVQSGEISAAKPQPFCRDCAYKNNCNLFNSC